MTDFNDDKGLTELARMVTASELFKLMAHDLGHRIFSLCTKAEVIHSRLSKLAHDIDRIASLKDMSEELLSEAISASQCLARLQALWRPRLSKARLFPVRPVVQKVADLIRGDLMHNKVHFVNRVGESLQLHGNPDVLEQVLLNLAINSLESLRMDRRKSPGTIEVSGDTMDSNDGIKHVRLTFSDDGPGISESFYQPEEIFDFGTTTRLSRTGTGLAVSRILLDRYFGGGMRLESRRPPLFVITIPQPVQKETRS